ncbi:MAG TPA: hypothetical protein PKJ14_06505 [Candidatus Cloacimonadota bacterium]|nr:hypothetical protein [Candidatus Cloacimonadota bacterium]
MKKLLIFCFLITTLLLSGCATLKIENSYIDPNYKLESIRTANIILGISDNVEAPVYKNKFYKVYESNQNYCQLYSDSLNIKVQRRFPQANVIIVDQDSLRALVSTDSIPLIQAFCKKHIINDKPSYLVYLKKTFVFEKVQSIRVQPNLYTNRSYCVTNFDVDVYDLIENKIVRSYTVSDFFELAFFNYSSTIMGSINKTYDGLASSLDQLIVEPDKKVYQASDVVDDDDNYRH